MSDFYLQTSYDDTKCSTSRAYFFKSGLTPCSPSIACEADAATGTSFKTSCGLTLNAALAQVQSILTTPVISTIYFTGRSCTGSIDSVNFHPTNLCLNKETFWQHGVQTQWNDAACSVLRGNLTWTEGKCQTATDGRSSIWILQPKGAFVTTLQSTTTTTITTTSAPRSIMTASNTSATRITTTASVGAVTTTATAPAPLKNGLPIAVIAGGAAGGIFIIVAVIAAICFCKRRTKSPQYELEERLLYSPPVTYPASMHSMALSQPFSPYTPSHPTSVQPPTSYATSESSRTLDSPQTTNLKYMSDFKTETHPLMLDVLRPSTGTDALKPASGTLMKAQLALAETSFDITTPGLWTVAQTCAWLHTNGHEWTVIQAFQAKNCDGVFLEALAHSRESCKESLRVDFGVADVRTRTVVANQICSLFEGSVGGPGDALPPGYESIS
ncbi:hypothetical protein BC830DRAFT_1102230 [Chytriomyces sp. MP71]|nr:hypothetical protein BC830DRAFT_1102230 [Chytriomyces sp. MP71]